MSGYALWDLRYVIVMGNAEIDPHSSKLYRKLV
jgi:hypothetical protein